MAILLLKPVNRNPTKVWTAVLVGQVLPSYNVTPAPGYTKAALYVIYYVHSTHNYGITFTSRATQQVHTYLHLPNATDFESYDDIMSPKAHHTHYLTTYSDTCQGSQIGNSVKTGTPIPLFKFQGMSGAIIFCADGPIAWKSVHQERTSFNSCEAEIRATNEDGKLTLGIHNLVEGFTEYGISLLDTNGATILYNDNKSCVYWPHN